MPPLPAAPAAPPEALAKGKSDVAETPERPLPSDDVRSDGGPHLVLRRRSWEEMDTLRAQMLLQGYPLAELRPAENERVWSSLVQRRRVPQLLALLGWGEDKLQLATERVRAQRGQHRAFQRARARRHLEKAEEP